MVVQDLVSTGKTEGLSTKVLNLSGLAKLESFTIQRLEKDLREIIERSSDASLIECVGILMPLIAKVAGDRQLSLWVDAGR